MSKIRGKIQYIIIGVLILIFLISIILTVTKSNNKQTKKVENTQKQENQTSESNKYIYNKPLEPSLELEKVKSISYYETIENCINKFLQNIYEEDKTALKSILINEYTQNIQNELKINYKCEYQIEKVYKYEAKLFIDTYFVYGNILNRENRKAEKFNFVVNVDNTNESFKLAPMENVYTKYVDYADEDNLKVNNNIKSVINEIKASDFNKVKIVSGIDSKEILAYYFKQYVTNMIYNTKKAYNLLDSDFKAEKFSSYDDFAKYVDNHLEELRECEIKQYGVKYLDDYKEYLCRDSFENVFYFIETEPMSYTVRFNG